VLLNWHWIADEIAYVLADAEAQALLVDPDFAAVARASTSRWAMVRRRRVMVTRSSWAAQFRVGAGRAARLAACSGRHRRSCRRREILFDIATANSTNWPRSLYTRRVDAVLLRQLARQRRYTHVVGVRGSGSLRHRRSWSGGYG